MKFGRMIVITAIASLSMACGTRQVESVSGTIDTTGLDPANLTMSGYARAPGVPVRVYATGCQGGGVVLLSTAISSTTPSFAADSTGQQGYAFRTQVDVNAAGFIQIYNAAQPDFSFGCTRLAMMEKIGNSWKFIAVFDDNAATCRSRLLRVNPSATYMQQIDACKLPSAWATYFWQMFG